MFGAESRFDVIVIGGGVVGLSIAYYLAGAGEGEGAAAGAGAGPAGPKARRGQLKVAVVDRGEPGRGATWAAAGMLAVQCEIEEPGPFLRLGVAARSLYEQLSRELLEETGIDIEHRPCGILRVALSDEERARLMEQVRLQHSWGLRAEWLEPPEVRRLEPALNPDMRGGAFLPDDGSVNNRRLAKALAAACARRGVRLFDHTEVLRFLVRGGEASAARKSGGGVGGAGDVGEMGEVLGVVTQRGELWAGSVVLAAGAWSKQLAAQLGVKLPVFPVKGEIIALQPAGEIPRHIAFAKGTCYLVPRAGGELLVGATQLNAGFRDAPTLGGLAALAKGASALAPSLMEAEVTGGWGGLRPGTPDGKPIVGRVPGWRGLYVATGHFRHGILLGPITGAAVARMILGAPLPSEFDARLFAPARFAPEPEATSLEA